MHLFRGIGAADACRFGFGRTNLPQLRKTFRLSFLPLDPLYSLFTNINFIFTFNFNFIFRVCRLFCRVICRSKIVGKTFSVCDICPFFAGRRTFLVQ